MLIILKCSALDCQALVFIEISFSSLIKGIKILKKFEKLYFTESLSEHVLLESDIISSDL